MRRDRHPESWLWETEEGQAFLARLLVATLYHFGLRHHVGAEQLSDFLKLLRVDTHLGVSPTALATLMRQLESQLVLFQQQQEAQGHCPQPERSLACDEVFFSLMMVLVAMDLSSNYIITEQVAEDRRCDTWQAALEPRLKALKIRAKHMVTDRASALIKLALSQGCQAGADLFHAQRELSRWLSLPLSRRRKTADAALAKAQEDLAKHRAEQTDLNKQNSTDPSLELTLQIAELKVKYEETAHQIYRDNQHAISLAVHPFEIDTSRRQRTQTLRRTLHHALDQQANMAEQLSINDKNGAVKKVRKQVDDIAAHVSVWWRWVVQQLPENTSRQTARWALLQLMPVVYWHQQSQRTDQPHLKARYQQAWQHASERFHQTARPEGIGEMELETWLNWCADHAQHFHRASSAVEGRNGCLAQLYHNGRGLTEKRLAALTVIHNYGIKRPDGSTPAQRFFKQDHPDLFEWLLAQTTAIPLPRKARKRKIANPLIGINVPG